MIAKNAKNFQQIRHRPARQVAGIANDDLINVIEPREQCPPPGIFSAPGDPAIINKRRHHRVATAFSSPPKLTDKFWLSSGRAR